MTRMWPNEIHPETVSGEKSVFERLKNDRACEDWIVLHSYHLTTLERKREGEADFIVFIPNRGVVVIEVKSHNKISFKESQWLYGNQEKPDQDPFKQAQDNMYGVRNILKTNSSKPKGFGKIPFCYVVIFPKTNFNYTSVEYEEWRLLDADNLNKKGISKFLLEAIENQILHDGGRTSKNIFDSRAMLSCAKILRPEMTSEFETYSKRLERINKEITEFTTEQNNAIDSGTMNKRLVVRGPAGTGKTVIATELAGMKGNQEKKVLFLCFNKGLSEVMKIKFSNQNFEIYTFHGFLMKNSTIKIPTSPDETFLNGPLLENAYENVLKEDILYDYIVIDEFQDLAAPDILIFLDRILEGGLKGGNWCFFADFEKQVLFKRVSKPEEVLSDYLGEESVYHPLRLNCRNTPSVVELIQDLTKIDPPYYGINRPDVSAAPAMKLYENNKEQLDNLDKSINQLLKIYDGREILVLSPIINGAVEAYNAKKKNKLKPIDFKNMDKGDGPFYSTIKAFKGLEFHAIILVDFSLKNFSSTDDYINQLYTGLSRSLETVHLHYSSDSSKVLFQ